ncbi:MAG: hypothetical protein ACOC7U_09565 [Spirochaetota bacterium]
MNKVKKAILIAVIVACSLHLLFVFMMVNFPYRTLYDQSSLYLTSKYSVDLDVQKINYHYPSEISLEGIKLTSRKKNFSFYLERAHLGTGLVGMLTRGKVEVSGSSPGVTTRYVELVGGKMDILADVKLLKAVGGNIQQGIEYVKATVSDAEVRRIRVSGFELMDVGIPFTRLALRKESGHFVFENSVIQGQLFTSRINGWMGVSDMDVKIAVSFEDRFYAEYPHLDGFLDPFTSSGSVTLGITGGLRKPRMEISSGID